ncbi:MAG: Bifunctional protein HldE [Chlamydiia bacterium]|nr:Bifunctional protein HldE [Chlamydiia bacterium]MCH9616415.1 Bifunctional protein HldE [Chlamydiia bacterium]MCH9629599.1 Bifunctional protein HldE [Chlamydiia bacterium]
MLKEAKALYTDKIKTVDELLVELEGERKNKKVIMCHGVFDIVHPGHLRHLLFAKSKGDILVVSITADKHITKGAIRPHVPQDLRSVNLAAFQMVDYVIVDHEAEPYENIKKIKPDYFAKGYEYVDGAKTAKTGKEKEIVESYGGEIIFTPGDVVYSSSKFIEMSPPKIGDEKLLALMESEHLSFGDLRDCIKSLVGLKVHVVGDTILDSYTQCSMIGGMTKTPTMSVRYERKDDFTGGAAVVAKHLRSAGAEVIFSTVLGNDANKDFILADLDLNGIDCRPIIDELRPTTQKNAITVGDYRLLKIDTVDNRPISDKILDELIDTIETTPSDGIVFSDFRHGIFNTKTISKLADAIPDGMFKVADSQVASRWGNILDFQGFDLITPNEKEARFSLGDQDSVVRHLGYNLFKKSKAKSVFLKLGERGLIVFRDAPETMTGSFFIDNFTDHAVDPVGAGDALLAYATLSMISTKNSVIAGIIGSLAAALECEYDGNHTVAPDALLQKIDLLEKRLKYEG